LIGSEAGGVAACCYDAEGDMGLGNVLSQSLDEIWRGAEFVAFRRRLCRAKASIPLCRECRPL
jgi:hypothetical protein